MSEPFIGEIRIFPYNFAPRSWAFCDGQLLPIAQNTALFSLYGTTYGGDGRNTFALPNLQGRAPMHPGRGPGLTSRRLGERLGTKNVTLSVAQIPSHSHGFGANSNAGTTNTPINTVPANSGFLDNEYSSESPDVDMNSGAILNTGGNQAHFNIQPFLVLNFCSALQGLYPSRS
ncbi:MAG: phage tail protein [Chitinophagales bacterium]